MKASRGTLIGVAALALAATGAVTFFLQRGGSESRLHAGKWELTEMVDLPPTPGQDPGPFHSTECLTADDPAPRGHLPPSCLTYDARAEGNTIAWRIRCRPPMEGDGTGEVTLSGDTLDGKITVRLPLQMTGAPRPVNEVLHGRRIGDCDAEQPPQ